MNVIKIDYVKQEYFTLIPNILIKFYQNEILFSERMFTVMLINNSHLLPFLGSSLIKGIYYVVLKNGLVA